MDFKKFNTEDLNNNLVIKILSGCVVGLIIICFILASMALSNRERVVIIPPHLDERMEISYNEANSAYKKSFAQYVAVLIGNVNPGNVKNRIDSLELAISPRLYTELRGQLLDSAKKMSDRGSSSVFELGGVKHNTRSDEVCVFGRQRMISSLGQNRDESAVYIMKVNIDNGLPQVISLDRDLGKIKEYCV